MVPAELYGRLHIVCRIRAVLEVFATVAGESAADGYERKSEPMDLIRFDRPFENKRAIAAEKARSKPALYGYQIGSRFRPKISVTITC